MGVENTTLLTGATVSATGGTNRDFTPDGVEVPNGIHLSDSGEPDFKIKQQLTLKTRNPQLNNGLYGKGKKWATLVVPQVLSDDSIAFNLIRIEVERHPDMAVSDYTDMLKQGAQLFIDTDLTDFWNEGSLK